jgi:hypothetical protein
MKESFLDSSFNDGMKTLSKNNQSVSVSQQSTTAAAARKLCNAAARKLCDAQQQQTRLLVVAATVD